MVLGFHLAVVAGLLLAAPAPAPAEPVVIGRFPIERAVGLKAHRVRLELSNYAGSRYGELSRRKVLVGKPGSVLEVDLRKLAAPVKERPARALRQCSFAVDCDEASVIRAEQELVQRYGAKAAPQKIERFVDEFIVKKSLAYGATPASTVATTRGGDCTEHAMLFTALARKSGHAARFVAGLVLVKPHADSPDVTAYGHAWGEVYDPKKGWQRHDPALRLVRSSEAASAAPPAACVAYVPIRLLDDEGPGFAGRSGFDTAFVQRVQVSAEFGTPGHCP
jgi:hypothetical protein